MDRDRLTELLDGAGEAHVACREALRRGARLTVADGTVPANQLFHTYRVRERITAAAGQPTLGFPAAVESLAAAADRPVRLGSVHQDDPPYHFVLFLSADADAVIACIGADQRHNAERRRAVRVRARHDAPTGEVDLEGGRDGLLYLADLLTRGTGSMPLHATGTAGPGVPLTRVEVRTASTPVRLAVREQDASLLVEGRPDLLRILGEIIRDTALMDEGGHVHVEHHPDHPWLAEGSLPLVLNSPLGGMPQRR